LAWRLLPRGRPAGAPHLHVRREEERERGLETLVTVTFLEEGGRTRMTFRQVPFQSVEERDGHRGGWTSTFDRLEQHLANGR
jgi:uncharacterized protein YndB with AHSA1/START domain